MFYCISDFEKVISHYLQQDDYNGALLILRKQSDVELYYKFSPLLMQYIPKETVTAWIAKSAELEPMKLIPALVQYDHDKYREQVFIIISLILTKVFIFPICSLILLRHKVFMLSVEYLLWCHKKKKVTLPNVT